MWSQAFPYQNPYRRRYQGLQNIKFNQRWAGEKSSQSQFARRSLRKEKCARFSRLFPLTHNSSTWRERSLLMTMIWLSSEWRVNNKSQSQHAPHFDSKFASLFITCEKSLTNAKLAFMDDKKKFIAPKRKLKQFVAICKDNCDDCLSLRVIWCRQVVR